MHVLGHSFSQKRKCTRPRDLHIRKVSFSGSSVSDGSLSSSTSTSSAYTALPTPVHTEQQQQLASPPLIVSPGQTMAPLRLHERAFKSSKCPQTGRTTTTFYDDTAVSDDDDHSQHYSYYSYYDVDRLDGGVDAKGSYLEVEGTQFHMELPPHVEHAEMDTPLTGDDRNLVEPADYFYLAEQHADSAKRTPAPRSRWSESTIQTLNEDDMTPSTAMPTPMCDDDDDASSSGSRSSFDDDDSEDEDDDELLEELEARQVRLEVLPNFSHKYQRTVSAPEARRPPMLTDSVEDFIKRGGWKRRGIVFDRREVGMRDSDCFTVI